MRLAARSRRVAAVLADKGIGRGDAVGVLMGKSADLPAVLLGIWRLGAVHVPLFTANRGGRAARDPGRWRAAVDAGMGAVQLVKREFAAHACPRRVHIVADLPKTPSGKIQRFKRREARAQSAGQ
ncbi:AMP-binding protein [Prauserella sp. PE36]|uniref:AMP-binding protein n=1 Tax=Prauserella sp. PE36 TaxID=1504709 RepID=UPI00268F123C